MTAKSAPTRREWIATPLTVLLLVSVTLSTFYFLRNYGPQAAIRRFHRAVESCLASANGCDTSNFQDFTVPPRDKGRFLALVQQTGGILSTSRDYQVVGSEPWNDGAGVVVQYDLRDGQKSTLVWVVSKRGNTWWVDSERTLTVLEDSGLR